MPRAARITGALRSHGTALALAGAAAAAVMSTTGPAHAATTNPHPASAARPDTTFSLGTNAATLTGTSAGVTLTGAVPARVVLRTRRPRRRPPRPARRPRHGQGPGARLGSARRPGAAAGSAGRRPAHPAGASHRARPGHAAAPARPYEIYDSVTPASIPPHEQAAVYATGNYAASPSSVARDGHVLWIDTQGSDPRASALDVELAGDATPTDAASWARAKLSADPNSPAIIYTMRSEWPATRAAIATLPAHMRSEVRWWIADPTGRPHIVPGANATRGTGERITTSPAPTPASDGRCCPASAPRGGGAACRRRRFALRRGRGRRGDGC